MQFPCPKCRGLLVAEDTQADICNVFVIRGAWRCINCGQRGDVEGPWGLRAQKVERRGTPPGVGS
jgi:hypothetical protein